MYDTKMIWLFLENQLTRKDKQQNGYHGLVLTLIK
jgi:hypothetical protein